MKFGKYITGGIVKVPKSLGSNGAILAGLGISPSMWRAVI
jgi:hypothetical protein